MDKEDFNEWLRNVDRFISELDESLRRHRRWMKEFEEKTYEQTEGSRPQAVPEGSQ